MSEVSLDRRVNTTLADTPWGSDRSEPVRAPKAETVVLATPGAFLGGVAVASATVAAFEQGMG